MGIRFLAKEIEEYLCALVLGMNGADERERETRSYLPSHLDALVWCILYDNPRRWALCYVHFADDKLRFT